MGWIAQKIATQLWKSYDTLFYGNGKKVYDKNYATLNSLEGKSNASDIRLKEDWLLWNDWNLLTEFRISKMRSI
ncbi:MAG: hypothetical protein ACI4C1_06545, partial [Lachnospiraceae bacterium]